MTPPPTSTAPPAFHVDAAELAKIESGDQADADRVRHLVTTAIALAGDPVEALALMIAAIGTLADNTDDPAAVLGVASQLVDEMLQACVPGLLRELRQPDFDSGDPS